MRQESLQKTSKSMQGHKLESLMLFNYTIHSINSPTANADILPSPPIQCFNCYNTCPLCKIIMVCKSICERILLKKYRPGYGDGKKYCSKCEIYLFHDGNFCPCCGVQLRTSPADKK